MSVSGAPRDRRSWHSVQLFDDAESLSGAVAAFIREGLSAGDHLLIVMKPELWDRTAARLERGDLPLADAIESHRLTVLDSRRALRHFMPCGLPDANLFDQTVGALVRELTTKHVRLRVYGDMVDVLATDGEFKAARRLEEFWNRLGEQHAFVLFCGYLAPNFADVRSATSLRAICGLHHQVHPTPDDMLSSYLLDTSRISTSPAARRT
jgi:hypothetical protein